MNEFQLKYGTNPNQKPARIFMADGSDLPVTILNGKPGYINFLDAFNSYQLVRDLKKALGQPAAASFKHVSPAGAAQRYVNMEGYLVGKRVLILGSGDIGLIMARRMTLEGANVLACVEVMPYSGGLTRNIVQCLQDFDIPLYLSHTIVEIQGKKRVEKAIVAKVDENRRPIPGPQAHSRHRDGV